MFKVYKVRVEVPDRIGTCDIWLGYFSTKEKAENAVKEYVEGRHIISTHITEIEVK